LIALHGMQQTVGFCRHLWPGSPSRTTGRAESNFRFRCYRTPEGDAKAQSIANAGLREVLSHTRWGNGDTPPTVVRVAGVDYWILVRGTVDTASHADARGRQVERHCLQLFAKEAVRDASAYLAPEPYKAFGYAMNWPEHAAECRMPGQGNYS
jgi:hypothetical protein